MGEIALVEVRALNWEELRRDHPHDKSVPADYVLQYGKVLDDVWEV